MTFPRHHHGMTQRAAGQSRPGPEPESVRTGAIIFVAIGLLGAIAIAMIAVWLLEKPLAADRPNVLEADTALPWARDWVHPGTELEEVTARAQQRLTTTEWIDRDAGIARIDIETAMRLLAGSPPPSREGIPPQSRRDGAPEPNDQEEAPAGTDAEHSRSERPGLEPSGAERSGGAEREAADVFSPAPPGTVAVPGAPSASSFILHTPSFHSHSSFIVHHSSRRASP